MGHQQLINVARKILPELSERSGEIDALRQIPQDLADKMAAEGFYRICTPAQLGGLAQDPNTLYEICETLASANGSAGWCIFIGSTSQYLLGALAQEQQHEMMTDTNVITSGVFADMGTALYEERDNKPGYLITATRIKVTTLCLRGYFLSPKKSKFSTTGMYQGCEDQAQATIASKMFGYRRHAWRHPLNKLSYDICLFIAIQNLPCWLYPSAQ